ncbi:MAG: putative response regulatory protein [Clostridia bacterium]|jgi:two-component system response regulator YesN|nr:putative response regulatory protein [Clostridia bacterium]
MKLIVVDDEVLVRKGIIMSIDWQSIGIDEVFEAANGEKALEIIKEQRVDIILTDIRMPKMDGLALIEEIKKYSPNSVSIVLSCVSDMDSVRQALKFGGALDYLPKLSASPEELMETIKKARNYVVKNVQTIEKQDVNELPSFFTLHHEERLRNAMEYGTVRELEHVIDAVLEDSYILKDRWKSSREWHDLMSAFSSILKKFDGSINTFITMHGTVYEVLDRAKQPSGLHQYIKRIAMDIKMFIEDYKKKNYDTNINQAIQYINKNFTSNLRLKDVAEYVHMSETYFSKSFKKIMDINFVDYINKMRIEEAKKLLLQRKMTIQEIAEQVGYNNTSYFTQTFKSYEGITPKQYQKTGMK